MNAQETVDAFFSAIESQDPARVSDMYTDDVRVWHNFSNATQSKTDNPDQLLVLLWFPCRDRLGAGCW